ncbi:MAG: type II toxin-antitoxin system death-on-curing family toxin [Candidatus Eremiobacteraeota bacterium]|nr:type II toxin-antitoxin system death-on-curing family toxin [Candidatus Eremiobacteraeota bacterium]MBC5803213.1 type II toxin-antitoxin system death-on-curing family toxin [Candidatus Eremiobacteraeota bacterium]MBC5823123.1 type II toxin-antitoxin system death-on-curing family toxin [Candidatus Eremiobacteraeota bacterium]
MSSRNKFDWLNEDVVLAIHEAQIAEHGGRAGVRDRGLLASSLARPQNAAAYSALDVPHAAALYALGIIKNHPLVDGNKRVGAVLLETFLQLHGYELIVTDGQLLAAILGLAAGETDDEAFVCWVRERAHLRSVRRAKKRPAADTTKRDV